MKLGKEEVMMIFDCIRIVLLLFGYFFVIIDVVLGVEIV